MHVFPKRFTRLTSHILSVSVALLSMQSESKELLGLNFSAGYWKGDLQGYAQSSGLEATDVDPAIPGTRFSMYELGLNQPKPKNYSIELRHKMKNVPRVMYRIDDIERSANTTPSRDIQFFEGSYVAGTPLSSSVDLSFTQATLFYSMQDNNWQLDIGASKREYDGQLQLEQEAEDDGSGGTPEAPILVTHPITGKVDMAYYDLAYRLSPTSTLAARVNQDIEAGVMHYDAEYGLRFYSKGSFATHKFEFGYRKFIIKTRQFDDLSMNLKLGGPYARWTLAY